MIKKISFVDKIYVINQNVSIDYLIKDINVKKNTKVVILTTHLLFYNEKNSIIKNTETQHIIFTTFSDYISDSEMLSCDKRAIEVFGNKGYDIQIFMTKSLKYKNKIVADKIVNLFKFNQLLYSNGLGISTAIWSKLNNSVEIIQRNNVKLKFSLFRKKLTLVKRITTARIKHQNKIYLFIGSVKRIKLMDNTKIKARKYNLFLLFFLLKMKSIKVDYLCTTIHNYNPKFYALNEHIYVFIDGYHPSNYPESYLPIYKENSIFIIRDYIDALWFSKFNKKISLPPDFISKEVMLPVKSKDYSIKNILLVLNHAGDWTSLINRSDTDILIENFIKLSGFYNEYNFTIRAHPTMLHESHEGKKSIERIEKNIEAIERKNIFFSKSSIENDIEENDLFITEYSNAFIDILKMGKLGIIVNLTNRRSFMKDYEEIGFLHANNFDELLTIFKSTLNNSTDAANKQNVAVKKYNEMQNKLYQELVKLGSKDVRCKQRGISPRAK